ncbi:MAG: hypothetical protein AAF467_13210 [Actinomycetota bacterium]
MGCDVRAARHFIQANARLLDQRLASVVLDGGEPEGIVSALKAYQNADGGFGHGLEPDKRAPASQPLDVEIAFEYLATAGVQATALTTPACDWLDSIAAASGAVPVLLPSVAGFPRAAHWEPTRYEPSLNPTAAIVAHAHALGVNHPWVGRATAWCFGQITQGRVPSSAVTLLTVAKLVSAQREQPEAAAAARLAAAAIPTAEWMMLDAEATDYGVTPLDFAPTPSSVARDWFSDDVMAAHLDRLERDQQPDGGWPLLWTPPSQAATCEWRAIRTLAALRTLVAYGRTSVRSTLPSPGNPDAKPDPAVR